MSITIAFCYPHSMPFRDASYEEEGVGGSEASLILVSRALARLGHAVTVYHHTPEPGVFHSVRYLPLAAYSPDEPCDIFVLFRSFQADVLRKVNAPVKLFWSCDQYPSPGWKANVVPYADAVLAISAFHKQYLIDHHGLAPEQVEVLDLGIEPADYAPGADKVPGKLLYCSVPNRGLRHLALLFPRIRAQVPHAELWVTSDFRLWGLEAGTEAYLEMFRTMDGVHFLGKVDRAELVRHQLAAQVMAYPCDWPENFCIAALECLAAGAVPVTSDLAALRTTVGGDGILLPGWPHEPAYQECFVAEVVRLLRDEDARRRLAEPGRRRALERYGWDEVVKSQWEPLFLRLLEEKQTAASNPVTTWGRLPTCREGNARQVGNLPHRQAGSLPHRQAGNLPHVGQAASLPRGESVPRTCRVSLTMIVKNEEATLAACLDSVAGLFDEIIVVDTGSSDRTRDIAAARGARVIDFAWVDSFAAARNESLRHATGDWVLWLDADERLDAANRRRLLDLFAQLGSDNAGYVMKQHSGPEGSTQSGTVVEQARLFRNHPAVRWEYRIHEQILPALGRTNAALYFTDIVISHVGYQDPALVAEKLQRNLRLIHLENEEHPDDPFTLFNLGWAYLSLGQTTEAVSVLQRSLQRAQPGASIVHKLYALLATAHCKLRQYDAALAACRAGLARTPGDAELLFLEGLLLEGRGDLDGAERCFAQLVPGPVDRENEERETENEELRTERPNSFLLNSSFSVPHSSFSSDRERDADHSQAGPPSPSVFGAPSFGSMDLGVRGHQAREHLAMIYQAQGHHAWAEAQWQAILTELPQHVPAWLHLAELYLAQQRWPDLDQIVERLRAMPPLVLNAAVLQARGYLARQEFGPARRLLEEAVARVPNALWPWVYLRGYPETKAGKLRGFLSF